VWPEWAIFHHLGDTFWRRSQFLTEKSSWSHLQIVTSFVKIVTKFYQEFLWRHFVDFLTILGDFFDNIGRWFFDNIGRFFWQYWAIFWRYWAIFDTIRLFFNTKRLVTLIFMVAGNLVRLWVVMYICMYTCVLQIFLLRQRTKTGFKPK
jgi:hypothetical protein